MLIKEIEQPDVKSIKDRVIHGTGVQFGTPETKDWDGEFFVPESELGLVNGANRPFILEHGFNKTFGVTKLADAVYEKSDAGWVYEATFLDTPIGNKGFQEVISKPYRSSAGAAGHTRRASIVKGASQLDVWMIAEQSATLTPADPNNPRVTRTKNDFMLFAIREMLQESEERVKAIINGFAENENIKNFLSSLKESDELRANLRDSLQELKDSFSSGEKIELTNDFIDSIEQVSKPIAIIDLH